MNNLYKLYQHGLIFKGAPHKEKQLSKKDCLYLLSKNKKALFVRNKYDFDCDEQTSFWYIINDRPITLDTLGSKVRNQVRKALSSFNFKDISSNELIDNDGYNVYRSSFLRYKNILEKPISKDVFKKRYSKKGQTHWGVFSKETDKLVAYADVLIQDNMAKYTALKAIPEELKKYPFYGLIFIMNKYYIEDLKLEYVTDGARSITEHSNIQCFLKKFNFRKAYCRISITYIWWLKIIINILFPFRNIIPIKKVKYLLRMEAIQRNKY